MVESKKRTFNPKVETKLTRQDFKRVDDLATVEGKTKSEVGSGIAKLSPGAMSPRYLKG